jgi:hypothetical protein
VVTDHFSCLVVALVDVFAGLKSAIERDTSVSFFAVAGKLGTIVVNIDGSVEVVSGIAFNAECGNVIAVVRASGAFGNVGAVLESGIVFNWFKSVEAGTAEAFGVFIGDKVIDAFVVEAAIVHSVSALVTVDTRLGESKGGKVELVVGWVSIVARAGISLRN